MNNIRNNGYNYGDVDKTYLVVRIIVVLAMIALGAFLWHLSQKEHSWKETEANVPANHISKVARQ